MSATPLPSLAPGVSADALAVIPSRLLKRAEKLAADSDSWQVTLVDDGFRVEVGTTTVTYVDKFECSCLISPKCAHIGAVCMAAPIAADAEDSDESPAGGVDNPAADKATTDTDSAAQAAWAKKLPAVADIAGCVSQAQDITSAICDQGLANLSARFHMQLLALVRTTRVVGLPRLERAITALATLSQDARVGAPINHWNYRGRRTPRLSPSTPNRSSPRRGLPGCPSRCALVAATCFPSRKPRPGMRARFPRFGMVRCGSGTCIAVMPTWPGIRCS